MQRPRFLASSQVSEWLSGSRINVPSRDGYRFDARAFDTANLVAWYSVQRPGPEMPYADEYVTQWFDLSGNGHTQTLATGTAAQYRTTGMNGAYPSIEFPASAYFSCTAFTHPQSWTAYAVVDAVSATTPTVRGLLNADNGSTVRQAQYLRWNTDTAEAIAFNTGGTTYTGTYAASSGASANPSVMVAKVVQGGNVQSYVNNNAGTGTATTGTLRALSSTMEINRAGSGSTNAGNVHYSEVILYGSTHDDTTRQAIQTALAGLYGITLA